MLRKRKLKKPSEKKDSKLFLVLNSANAVGLFFGIGKFDGGIVSIGESTKEEVKTLGVVGVINKHFKKNKLSFFDLTAIGLVQNAGSFSMLRSIVSFANTMHWLLGIKLYEIKLNKKGQIDLTKKIAVSGFIIPKYTSAPNISKPKE